MVAALATCRAVTQETAPVIRSRASTVAASSATQMKAATATSRCRRSDQKSAYSSKNIEAEASLDSTQTLITLPSLRS